MEGPTRSGALGLARRGWLPLVLAVTGMAALAVGRASDPAPPPGPPDTSLPAVRSGSPTPAAPRPRTAERTADLLRGPHLPASTPVTISIPALGLSAPLSQLGLADDGTLETPGAADEVGWFNGSVTPGAVGPAVIVGHVTWGGPAVFYDLATLDRSDRVLVRRQDGRTAIFAVTEVRRVSKARFPTEDVYGATDHAALRLITCGGRFDTAAGRYADNVVVFGRLVAVRR